MGCGRSSKPQVIRPVKTFIPQSYIDIVQSTWAIVSQQPERFGVSIYNSFLSQEQEIKQLFPGLVIKDGCEMLRLDEGLVRRHALLVLDGLGLAVESINDKAKLDHILHCFGVGHFKAGVKADMLMKLYPAVDEGVRTILADAYNRTIRRAWKEFFVYMADTMKLSIIQQEKAVQ